MRLLLCCLFMLCSYFTFSQNVGINTPTPQKTLHINGELKVDSASYLRKVYLKDALDSTRMVLDPDNGKLEFWDNDTLWYQLQVASPPTELRSGGNYTVERDWGQDYNGDPAIVTTYKNAAGEIVRTNQEVVISNPDDTDDLVINEIYEDGCLVERTIQHGPSGGSTREIFDCPSGTLCLKEEVETNNSTGNTSFSSITTLTDVKNGKVLSSVTQGQNYLGNLIANKKFIATTVANNPLGTIDFQIDSCLGLNMLGANNQGFQLKVIDLFANPLPAPLVLEINEDNKLASFCNTTELEQKIDSTLRRRGILDNSSNSFSSRIQTPSSWLQSTYSPIDGIYGQSSSICPVAMARYYNSAEYEELAIDAGLSIIRSFRPSIKFMQFEHSDNPLRYSYQWLSTPNISFVRSVRDTANSSVYTMTTVPSESLMRHSSGSSIVFSHQLDTTNKIYVKRIEDISTSQFMTMTFDPQASIFVRDAGADLRMVQQFDGLNNQVVNIIENGATGADIFSWMQPELAPAQSIWQMGSNQNNLNAIFNGNFNVQGILAKLAGAFKIDHPLDPYNKYLVHSFVESPDMMNIYNGNITTDESGIAVIDLPEYFDALNIEPRYQLTVIGSFDQAIVYKEVSNNQFSIKTSAPNVKVSWQVTGIRNDTFAKENRLVPEVTKEAEKKGTLLYEPKGSGSQ